MYTEFYICGFCIIIGPMRKSSQVIDEKPKEKEKQEARNLKLICSFSLYKWLDLLNRSNVLQQVEPSHIVLSNMPWMSDNLFLLWWMKNLLSNENNLNPVQRFGSQLCVKNNSCSSCRSTPYSVKSESFQLTSTGTQAAKGGVRN